MPETTTPTLAQRAQDLQAAADQLAASAKKASFFPGVREGLTEAAEFAALVSASFAALAGEVEALRDSWAPTDSTAA